MDDYIDRVMVFAIVTLAVILVLLITTISICPKAPKPIYELETVNGAKYRCSEFGVTGGGLLGGGKQVNYCRIEGSDRAIIINGDLVGTPKLVKEAQGDE